MSKNDTLLIIAGTHQREKEFSHSVADLLIKQNNLDINKPNLEITGNDKATSGLIWESKNLVVAKLYEFGSGIPCEEWLRDQTLTRLVMVFEHKMATKEQSTPPRIAEEGQWTSVHNSLIKRYNPLFFVDLHSNHKYTEGIKGKGMQINSYADKKLNIIILKALSAAQEKEPEIYGPKQEQLEPKYKILHKLIEAAGIKNEIIKELSKKIIDKESKTIENKIREIQEQADSIIRDKIDKAYDNGWFFTDYGRPELRGNYFLFEAKHWQKSQQEAAAHFIIEYLIPEVKRYK